MAEPDSSLWVLRARSTKSSGGALEDSAPYTLQEIRAAIRLWYRLPNNTSIKLDIKRVYPWLGREYQDVFQLYARGYTHEAIGRYWYNLNPHTKMREIYYRRASDCSVIPLLVKRIVRLLGFDLCEMSILPKKSRQKLLTN